MYLPNAYFGAGNGPIFPNYLECRGNESSLADCKTDFVACTNHAWDVGVICQDIGNEQNTMHHAL